MEKLDDKKIYKRLTEDVKREKEIEGSHFFLIIVHSIQGSWYMVSV